MKALWIGMKMTSSSWSSPLCTVWTTPFAAGQGTEDDVDADGDRSGDAVRRAWTDVFVSFDVHGADVSRPHLSQRLSTVVHRDVHRCEHVVI
jgi:hypothetical protein